MPGRTRCESLCALFRWHCAARPRGPVGWTVLQPVCPEHADFTVCTRGPFSHAKIENRKVGRLWDGDRTNGPLGGERFPRGFGGRSPPRGPPGGGFGGAAIHIGPPRPAKSFPGSSGGGAPRGRRGGSGGRYRHPPSGRSFAAKDSSGSREDPPPSS